MRYTVRPISDRSWIGGMGKTASQFSAKWGSTLQLLDAEIGYLKGRNVVLEIDVTESDLKLNGELRANAKPSSAAVAVAFEGTHGPMYWPCDRFFTNWAHQGPDWQHNVRAIAKTMEALRAADRYGATGRGQQYLGFKALPAGTAMGAPTSSHLTSSEAQGIVLTIARADGVWPTNDTGIARVVKLAKRWAHPDQNAGDHTLWRELAEALQVLRLDR
jgi:hypothetical protein